MTLPEKCRMLLELAKKAISPFYPHSYNGRAFQEAVNPTTVQEICEAYLNSEIDVRYYIDISAQNKVRWEKAEARIQDLEAALKEECWCYDCPDRAICDPCMALGKRRGTQ